MNRFGYVSFSLLFAVGLGGLTGVGCSQGAVEAGAVSGEVGVSSYALVVSPEAMPALSIGAADAVGASRPVKGLLLRAATQCRVGMRFGDQATPRVSANFTAYFPNLWEKSGNVRALFSETPVAVCDRVLEQSEALVCMADKLAQIADAVGTLRWDTLPSPETIEASGFVGEESFAVAWSIPPQAEKDRFIARDLALHLLATAARLDGTPLPVFEGNAASTFTCGEIYSALDAQVPAPNMADAGVRLRDLAAMAFDDAWQGSLVAPAYMPVAAAAWNARMDSAAAAHDVARPRVLHELKLLRTAGALTRRLVQASVAADAAGAAAKMARASDTRVGAENAWGLRDKYDSLAHASRVLTGRIEAGAVGAGAWLPPDMACAKIGAMDVAERAYAGSLRGRIEDPTLETHAQLAAANLAAMLGVAVPRERLESVNAAELQSLFADQLVFAQSARSNATTTLQIDAIRNGALGVEWRARLAQLSKTDLLVGVEYTWATARMRVGAQGETFDHAVARSGLARAAGANEKLVHTFGATPVYDEVLDRRAVPRDQWSRSVTMAGPGTCAEPNGYAQAFGVTAPSRGVSDLGNWRNNDLDRVPRWVSQDPFSLAQYLERRATVIGARVAPARGGEGDARAEAARVATELRAWAGPARVFVSSVEAMSMCSPNFGTRAADCADPAPTGFEVELHGAVPEALGLAREDVDGASDRALTAMRLVAGYPYEAECVATGGVGCRALPDGRGALTATSFARVRPEGGMSLAATMGVHEAFVWRFDSEAALKAFAVARDAASARGDGVSADTRLYLVGPDPRHAGRLGILGEIAVPTVPRTPDSSLGRIHQARRFVVSFPLATLQQSALVNVMSLPVSSTTPQVSGGGAGAPGASCVENQDSLFVPLDNDMIQGPAGTEDSWRYWLDRASILAAEADRHASDLLAARLVVENRRENAATRLASICGTTGAVSRLKITNNEIDTSGDTALANCLSTENIDVFTFGQVPVDDAAKRAVFERVAGDLDCPAAATASPGTICRRLRAGDATHASAELSLSRLKAFRKTPACGEETTRPMVPRGGPKDGRLPLVEPPTYRLSLTDVLATAGRARGLDALRWVRDGYAVGYTGIDLLSSLHRTKLAQDNEAKWSVSVGGDVRLASDVIAPGPGGAVEPQPWPSPSI